MLTKDSLEEEVGGIFTDTLVSFFGGMFSIEPVALVLLALPAIAVLTFSGE